MYHWTKSCCCCCMQCAHILLLLLLLLIYVTNANGFAPKYQTAYACEGKKLTIECEPGDLINLIRANYGRFSITICNDHGNVDWSVNCMFPRSLPVLASRCAHRQNCSVLATTSMFGDPCPGTHKYLEAHYVCISASQTTTTTTMRPTPPWLKTPLVPPIINGNSSSSSSNSNIFSPRPPVLPSYSPSPPVQPQPPRLPSTVSSNGNAVSPTITPYSVTQASAVTPTMAAPSDRASTDLSASSSNVRIPNGVQHEEGGVITTFNRFTPTAVIFTPNSSPIGSTMSTDFYSGSTIRMLHNNNNAQHLPNINNNNAVDDVNSQDGNSSGNNNFYCGPTNSRNLFWNITRVSDVNVQPCPGGATGIAKWRCVLMKRTDLPDDIDDNEDLLNSTPAFKAAASTVDNKLIDCKANNVSNNNCNNNQTLATRLSQRLRNFRPVWHPQTPDLTQCRSLWLNNLEIRVNQGDSSLISIANDLSEVTSSKTLYGGDMLVTTKIIQTMSEKMFHDKETYPEQREAVIMELLLGVVKTGSNLLDESQLASWLDLNQEDQMRVATSLLTGLEYSAFLLADTIMRERNVVQKVKNILLTVRVLETKNIQSHEVFPHAEQWPISDDRIEIPRAALVENSEAGLVRVVFAAFDRLESILKPSYDHFDDKSARNHVRNTVIINNDTVTDAQQQRVRILNSKVISASLGKGRHTQLSQPIKLVLRHLRTQNVTNPTCVFWNYIDHAWSENGCSLESSNRTHSICMCNHLTNFAILMDVVDSRGHSLFGMFDGNMRIMIYISVGICLLFILVALLTLKLFNGGVFMKVSEQQHNVGQQQQHHLSTSALSTSRSGSSRRQQQNNIRDQTHEPLTLVTPTNNYNYNNSNNINNNIQQLQQQLNLQHLQNMLPATNTTIHNDNTMATTNFIQHNSLRNLNRNNLNVNNFHLLQQQQSNQHQPQQQVVAAAVVLSNGNTNQTGNNIQMNNLNFNVNLHTHSSNIDRNNKNNINNNVATPLDAMTAAATASIAAVLQQAGNAAQNERNNLNINRHNNFNHNNINLHNNSSHNNNNSDNIIIQGNMNDLHNKWWWW